jgi:CRP-like cAMP-binding protein
VKKGEIIFRFGETGDTFYVVLKGSVGVKVPTDVQSSTLNDHLEGAKFLLQYLQAPILKTKD